MECDIKITYLQIKIKIVKNSVCTHTHGKYEQKKLISFDQTVFIHNAEIVKRKGAYLWSNTAASIYTINNNRITLSLISMRYDGK